MTSTSQLESIFFAALERPVPQRAAFLDEACGGDTDLRRRLEKMLSAQAEAGSFLERPAVADDMTVNHERPITEQPGTVIGPYKLLQQIGEGGMGVVFMAEQTEPIQRTVALKIIKPGMDTRQVIARFEAERQALAMMDHPNIAKVLDAGVVGPASRAGHDSPAAMSEDRAARLAAPTGRPYFVMDLVKGVPITKYCDEKQLSLRERLELFMQVCQAVQHAHQKGIIHRDIKPTNVIVAEYDNHAVPKVIDFGVAKATAQKLTERTMFTEFGQVIGTVEYMSPEQAKLNQLDIDTRSDVYSLGVLLYELLTGSTPFEQKRLREAAFDEVLRIIREEEPPKPSTRLSSLSLGERAGVRVPSDLSSIAANRHTEPARLNKDVQGDLDWIVMKALEKDRNRRYQTANGFAADIQHHLNDEAVQACPPSAAYRFRKFARRNKRSLAAAALIGLVLVLGTVISTWQALRATRAEALAQTRLEAEKRARHRAITEALKANAVSDLMREMFESAAPNPKAGPNYTVRQLLDDFSSRIGDQVKAQPEVELQVRTTIGNTYGRLALTKEAEPHLRKALELRRQVYGAEHVSVGDALMAYAWNLRQAGDGAGAEQYAREALAIYEKRNADPKLILSTYTSLTNFLQKQSKNAEAEALGQKALAYAHQHGQEEQLSGLLMSLSGFKRLGGSAAEAEKLSGEALALERRRSQSPSPYILLEHAANLSVQGKHAEAEPLLREALAGLRKRNFDEAHSSMIDVKSRLADLLYFKGDREASRAAYLQFLTDLNTAIAQAPDALEHRFRLAVALERLGRLDEAIAAYTEAFSRAPNARQKARALKDRGECYVFKGDHAKAIEDITEALKVEPGYPDALAVRAGCYLALGRTADALADYSALVKLKPRDAGLHNSVAWQLSTSPDPKLRDAKFAVEIATKAVQLVPTEGMYWNTLGVAQFRAGDWKAAITALEKSTQLRNGGDCFDWFFLAMSHWQLGNKDEARKWHDKAVEWMEKMQSGNQELIRFRAEADEVLDLARSLVEGGRLDEAAEVYRRAGVAWRNSARWDDALANYSKAIELNPKLARAWAGRGWTQMQLNQLDKALADQTKSIELDPKEAVYWNNRSVTYLKLNKPDDALADCAKAIELDPKFAPSWLNRGEAYRMLAQHEKAAEAYLTALRLKALPKPDIPVAERNLATVLESMEKNQPDSETLRRFRTEAEELLGITEKQPDESGIEVK